MARSLGDGASSRPFQDLYSVVVGVSLALAVEGLVEIDGSPHIRWALAPYFLAYAATAFPIYHWSVRYITWSYQLRDLDARDRTRVFAELWIGAVELLLLVVLPLVLASAATFVGALTVLFTFEVGAGVVMRTRYPAEWAATLGATYTRFNGAAALLFAVLWVVVILTQPTDAGAVWIGVGAALICIIRTVMTYRTLYEFFFEDPQDRETAREKD